MKKINELVSSYHKFRNIFIFLNCFLFVIGMVVSFAIVTLVMGPTPFHASILSFVSTYSYIPLILDLTALVVLVISFFKFRKATHDVQGGKVKLLTVGDYIAIVFAVLLIFSFFTSFIFPLFDRRPECERLSSGGLNFCDLEKTINVQNQAR